MRALALLALLLAGSVNAAPTCVLIGDSIMSSVHRSAIDGPYGDVKESASSIIQDEANVFIRNISSPGASLGSPDATGFGNVKPTLDMIGGMFNYYNCIIIQAGTNDFGRSIRWEDMVSSLRKIMDVAKANNKKVLMTDLIYRSNENQVNSTSYNMHNYRYLRAVVCNEYAGTCFFASRTGTVFDTYTPELYDANEIGKNYALHLNAAGHREYANWVISAAKKNNIF